LRALERANVEEHTYDRRDTNSPEDHRGDERERNWKRTFATDKTVLGRLLPRTPRRKHELQMIENTKDEHQNSNQDQRNAEIASWSTIILYRFGMLKFLNDL
jgi:hypothetical protein